MTATRTAKSNRLRLAKHHFWMCITLFLNISLPSLHNYNVKLPNFTFCRRHKHKPTSFFSFSELWYSPLKFNSRKICQHLTNWTKWNNRYKVWSSMKSLFKWRFRSRHCCCLSSLFTYRGTLCTRGSFWSSLSLWSLSALLSLHTLLSSCTLKPQQQQITLKS